MIIYNNDYADEERLTDQEREDKDYEESSMHESKVDQWREEQ